MKIGGVITRVERGRGGLVLIVRTGMGLRGVDVERAVWEAIRADYELAGEQELVGWEVEYDPEHGDLEIMGPPPDSVGEDAEAGVDDHAPPD